MVQQLKGKTFYTENIHSNTNLLVKAKYVYLNTNNLYINSIPLYELITNIASNKHDESFIFLDSSKSEKETNGISKKLLFRNITTKNTSKILTLSAENEIHFDAENILWNQHKMKEYIEQVLDTPIICTRNKEKMEELTKLSNDLVLNNAELDIQLDIIEHVRNEACDYEIRQLENKNTFYHEDIMVGETLSDIVHDIAVEIKMEKNLNSKKQQEIKKDLMHLDVENKNMKYELEILETQIHMSENSKQQNQEDCDHNKLGSYFVNDIVADKIEPLDCHDIVEITNETGINLCIRSLKDVNDVFKKIRFGN
jgi:hypothetical protein